MTTLANNERRRFNRVTFHCPVELTTTDSHDEQMDSPPYWQGQLIDISLKGVLVNVKAWQHQHLPTTPTSESLQVGIELGGDARIHMFGHVVRIDGDMLAITCDKIDMDSISHLRRLLELNSSNEQAHQRELHELIEHHI
ncbi:PilZ domain-containing protein [Marinibactrum halimedae]|uniref:Cyclic diguanosine monophosphate-binding protein n=1 Tax=Marinibactrum halimedae TaxID=1444977 RepID=A0AA37T9B2_9GAMM|nr:PilZ domain-containing protein [Marinibactrum halimedae]MCD9460479.1 PilZ domain-containing protein [Marinibactrum halimedae]GLS25885.1 cyclic diguanosine monophosphate-binding protein [Marinibactrum halimedae]